MTDLPFYEPSGNEIALFEHAYRERLPLLIKGPTGCGKTRFVAHMAARLKLPLYTVACPAANAGDPLAPPLSIETSGLSKGFITLNGRDLTRYFTATGGGKKVGPRTRFNIPRSWLRPSGMNDLLIFDEHGFAPGSCRIVSGE